MPACRNLIRSPLRTRAVHDADIGDRAAILVVHRVEHHRLQCGVGIARRRRHALEDGFKYCFAIEAGLGAAPDHFIGVDRQRVFDFFFDLVDAGVREIDLVDHGDDRQVVLHCSVRVGDRLGFHALERIDQQQSAFAADERARYFVMEIDVAGRIDEIELVLLPIVRVLHRDRVGLDRDAALALQVHRVEHLLLHLAAAHRAGQFQQPIGQRALAVVDVGDDREVPDVFRIGHGGRIRIRYAQSSGDRMQGTGNCMADSEPVVGRVRQIPKWRRILAAWGNRSNYRESAAVASRSAIRRARWNSAISSCSLVGVDIPLAAAERHGRNAVRREPIGVEAAVRDGKFGGEVFCLDRRRCRRHTRFVAAQAKRFVIEPAIESDATTCSIDAAHGGGRSFECGFDFFHDPLAKLWIVAASFGADVYVVGHDVRRVAAADDADVARAVAVFFGHKSVPAAFHQNRPRRATRWRSR